MEQTMRIAIVDAGVMGAGIAYTAALSRDTVTLHDWDLNLLQRAHQQIRTFGEKGVARGRINPHDWTAAFTKRPT
jgi:3-hydroxyacyl-CoA dehydrogenase